MTNIAEAATGGVLWKKVFLEISQNLPENTFARASEACAWGLQLYLKKILSHRCFPVNFAKFLRTTFFIEQLWWLLLQVSK